MASEQRAIEPMTLERLLWLREMLKTNGIDRDYSQSQLEADMHAVIDLAEKQLREVQP